MIFYFIIFNFLMIIYIWERERERNRAQEWAERERDKESKAGSRLWAVSTEPDVGLEPLNHEIVTWAKVVLLTD